MLQGQEALVAGQGDAEEKKVNPSRVRRSARRAAERAERAAKEEEQQQFGTQ